jgi:metallophosphoesterase superfamily enzyme
MMRFCQDWRLLPQRFAVHEPSGTAVLADVHLGYSAARQHLGDAIPWRSVAEEMQPLADAARTHDLRALLVAGDLFERGYDTVLFQQFLDVLDNLHLDFVGLVPGNHDRGIEKAAQVVPLFSEGYDLAGWRVVHGDQPIESTRAVLGHWHPALRWKRRKVPCFLARGTQLVLPAFSLDAAGVDVATDARWRDWECYAIVGIDVIQVEK